MFGPVPKPLLCRAEKFIDRSGPCGCWNWTGRLNNRGYGEIYSNKKRRAYLAHRAVYEETHGVELSSEVKLLHSCDNPKCVNPKHLTEGTQKQNMLDAASKGRTTRGEKNPQAILTESEVRTIRKLYVGATPEMTKRGDKGRWLAKMSVQFNVAPMTVNSIIRNDNWKEVS